MRLSSLAMSRKELQILDIAAGGEAIAREDGKVIFVGGAIPAGGHIGLRRLKYAYAKAHSTRLEPSMTMNPIVPHHAGDATPNPSRGSAETSTLLTRAITRSRRTSATPRRPAAAPPATSQPPGPTA